ncbi:AbrB family transcriptional regulator [Pelotomaculum terephthalicicum JT]|uniref:AbrB family transcriptional regulator n=1 Tax=Pelotomaculum terephthalicicum TaxID=206393 RepID=UPI001F04A1BF|nr:AbrB family transcriptional regulator [Pelotomaculum terephthalicicum]MCG9969203.1 AbrB family transcriptional regulator [Pelotomaculum terephthalicicum JT]
MAGKGIYKVLDDKGRVLIPKELRAAAEMQHGDIIKLGIQKGVVTAKKVDLIKVGDKSPQAVEAYVFSAVKTMEKQTLISLAGRLIALLEENTKE